jgi:hypothetical protein
MLLLPELLPDPGLGDRVLEGGERWVILSSVWLASGSENEALLEGDPAGIEIDSLLTEWPVFELNDGIMINNLYIFLY